MRESVLVDAGPLVALFNRRDALHQWAAREFSRLRPPLLTTEPVITEAAHLIAHHGGAGLDAGLIELLHRKVLKIALSLDAEAGRVAALLRRYRNIPMSLADASLVRLSELHERSRILTADSDFLVYRRNARQNIPVLMPHD